MLNLLKCLSFSIFAIALIGYYTVFDFFHHYPDFLDIKLLVLYSLYAFRNFSKYLAVVGFTVKIDAMFC